MNHIAGIARRFADDPGSGPCLFDAYPKPFVGHPVLMTEDVFHPDASSGTGAVGCLFLFIWLPVSLPFVVNPAQVSPLFLEIRLSLLRAAGLIGLDGATTVLLVEQLIEGVKQLFHQSMTSQLLPEPPECLGIGCAIFQRQPAPETAGTRGNPAPEIRSGRQKGCTVFAAPAS